MKRYFCLSVTITLLHLMGSSQVPVSMEPRHHKILDNGHVRLLDVHIPPGDTTQMHIHATPSVFLVLNDVKTGSQVTIEEDHSTTPIPKYGNISFEGFYKQARIHRVWNSDTAEFHVMDIELTNKEYMVIDSPITNAAFTFLFDEKPVRAYLLTIWSGTKISVPPRRADILMIQISDSVSMLEANEKSFHVKGDFIYTSAGSAIEIKNQGKEDALYAFFEIK